MAIPALPADDSDGNDLNAAKVNAIYDLLQLFRDTRPVFKGASRSSGTSIADATTVEVGFGSVSGTFTNTPGINVGGFTVGSSINGDSQYNLVIPEAGIYAGFWHVEWASHATGRRILDPNFDSAPGTAVKSVVAPASGGVTAQTAWFLTDQADATEFSSGSTSEV